MMKEIFVNEKYTNPNMTTDKGSLYYCLFEADEYLHVFFYGLNEDRTQRLLDDLLSIGKKLESNADYVSFLAESNGALLYSGSINMFGYEDCDDSFDDSPSSIVKMNMVDAFAKKNDSALYIGNCPCSKGGNVNFYYMLDSSTIQLIYNGEVICACEDMQTFFKQMYYSFDDKYLSDGRNKFFGDKDKYVYNNIQKLII